MEVGMESQFTKACEECSDGLFRYAFFKVHDRELAKDLVQETFMKTWSFITKGSEKIKNLRAFFYKILSNLIIDEYRKKRPVSLDALSEEGFEPVWDNAENLEDKIDGEKALEMLKYIPTMYREVILMRYVQDLSLSEIAEITKESENAIAVKVHRALKKIREIFKS